MALYRAFTKLADFLLKIPAIDGSIGLGSDEEDKWWVKLTIDISHKLAWQTVQELGHVLNYLSIDERLPTTFHPVSPPPYMSGGPEEYLSWVNEKLRAKRTKVHHQPRLSPLKLFGRKCITTVPALTPWFWHLLLSPRIYKLKSRADVVIVSLWYCRVA